MATSSTVASGDTILASAYNNLRTDVLSTHVHDGTDGSQLSFIESVAMNKKGIPLLNFAGNLTPSYTNAGAYTTEGLSMYLTTDTASGDYIRYLVGASSGAALGQVFAATKSTAFSGTVRISFTTLQDVNFLFGSSNNIYTDATTTDRHYGFMVEDGTLYASNGNNTTQTRTDISSGITLTSWNTYTAIFTTGVNCKFYVNGTLKATHTTNLPTTGITRFQIGVQTQTTAARGMEVLNNVAMYSSY
jgi:hypothetical protein